MGDATQATQALTEIDDIDDTVPKERVWARLITLNPARPTIDLVGTCRIHIACEETSIL